MSSPYDVKRDDMNGPGKGPWSKFYGEDDPLMTDADILKEMFPNKDPGGIPILSWPPSRE